MTKEEFSERDKTICDILYQIYLLNEDIQFFYGNSKESIFLVKRYGFFNRYVKYLPKLLTIEIDKLFNTDIKKIVIVFTLFQH